MHLMNQKNLPYLLRGRSRIQCGVGKEHSSGALTLAGSLKQMQPISEVPTEVPKADGKPVPL